MEAENSIQVPKAFKYQNINEYFCDFVESNRLRDPKLTTSVLSQELGWPASYLRQITISKRHPTLPKVMEFAKHFCLDIAEIEYLLCLASQKGPYPSLTATTRMFLNVFLNTNPPAASPTPAPLKEHVDNINLRILAGLFITRGLSAFETLQKIFDKQGWHLNRASLQGGLLWLEKAGILKKDSQRENFYEILQQGLMLARMNPRQQNELHEFISWNTKLQEQSRQPFSYRKIVKLKGDQAEDIKNQLFTLKNLINFFNSPRNSESIERHALITTIGWSPLNK